ncbi:alkylation response protein AidB-like acyl-CoA dehydrogenase [Amycolatopsis bartoniae]|uniref:Acyl-CoA dehydrogenase n=1 Tax=Amycolatopsis bartoniae TaxID=941986 RepID=A0A8H9M401_9PSEU|nr:acyl-CoA dehydrogenase family protein [Amycolatopsis bartoniae]MBB2934909.1 alkylation response protein AidB-like acyl-CoA dehydrogenase [Amycolatopsis bartoniae]TVS99514.1 acyl-CoA dehydrogenase [Amycolatopsis bartoniae]GHF43908.1 acyl-CoA dehydrogenase [Amycolatopsis bartoniae]
MPVERLLPDRESADLLALATELAREELKPRAAEYEEAERFPREQFRTLGKAGLLGLPYPERWGGGEVPYEVYLQVLEEIAAAWMSVGVGLSVHTMSCFALAYHGTDEQRDRWLPSMVEGELLGAYALSEPHAGSDPASLSTRARRDGEQFVVNGTKAWITHGGQADFYATMVRTGEDAISCLLVDGGTPGLAAAPPERKMGLTGSTTTQLIFSDARVDADRLLGAEGAGLRIALSSLDSGRLGIAACAVGLAQAALDEAVAYAKGRSQFGKPIIEFQGLEFLLADMAAAVDSARATVLDAARRRDRGMPFRRQASIAKLVATDAAMKVTTDAVQVLGGAGYTRDFPVERYMREAKVLQIFEGTNQIQRLVIGRELRR